METSLDRVAIRVHDRQLSLRQLLRRARIEDSMPVVERAQRDLAFECWAESLGLAPDRERLQAALTRFRRDNGLFAAARTNEWLRERGAELDDLIALLRPAVLREQLAERVVSEEEIGRYFAEHALEYDEAEISRMVVREYGQAQELRFRIEEGADFHRLARQYSQDRATAKSGGYAGFARRGQLEPEVAVAVFAAEAGDVVGPFEGARECSLVLVEEIRRAELTEPVIADIRGTLFRDKFDAYVHSLTFQEELWKL